MKSFPLLLIAAAAAAALAGCASPGVGAAVRGDSGRLGRILDEPNHGGENLGDLMTNSVAFDCADCVRLLLRDGAKPGAEQLGAAALAGHEKTARLLIGAGADPEAAMAVIHAETRKWIGGGGVSPEQARAASDLFKKIERESPSSRIPVESAPAASAPVAVSTQPAASPAFREAPRPDDFAVVVGLEEYDGLPPAPYAERDASAVSAFIEALGVPARNVVNLTGAHATKSWLTKELEGWLPDNVDENSTVYFYFSGLGAADPESGLAYLVPFDGDPRYPAQTSYPLERLYKELGALKAKRAIAVLDTSFSGMGGRSVMAKGAQLPKISIDAGFNAADGKVALLAAADGSRSSGTDGEKGYGLFTYRLLEGLNGAAKDPAGQVTLKSLFDYVKPRVMSDARRSGGEQVPLFESGGMATDHVVLRGQ